MSIASDYNNIMKELEDGLTYCMYRRYKIKGMTDEDIKDYIENKKNRRLYIRGDFKRFQNKYGEGYLLSTYMDLRRLGYSDEQIGEKQLRNLILNARAFMYECYIDNYVFGFTKNAYLKYCDIGYTDEEINDVYVSKNRIITEIFTKSDLEYIRNLKFT